MDPLKLLLNALGISVEHLVEGLKKCVNELGPEASEAVKKLLVTDPATKLGLQCIIIWLLGSELSFPFLHATVYDDARIIFPRP
ncbi:hypothetical protein GH733_009710 [Mirounga leonina]|nr:hypothetical protein GH733_009710 [Mirounga leonina]